MIDNKPFDPDVFEKFIVKEKHYNNNEIIDYFIYSVL